MSDNLYLITGTAARRIIGDLHERATKLREAAPGVASEFDRVAAELVAANEPEGDHDGDALLDIKQASQRLGMSEKWLYNNAHKLPFTRRVGPRALRFSEAGIKAYLARKR